MKITNYTQAIDYLEGFIGKVIFQVNKDFLKEHDPLERMRVLLSLLGNPQEKFKSILVGGTSGKGSTAYLISHILTTAGYKTGFTLSPHLQKVNERLQINGKQISDKKFTKSVSSIVRTIELMKGMEVGAPSYFEIIVAMAFKYFADQKVDIAIVEVGMGGEFDATNTLDPLIAVLTNVGLDHTNVLGKTVEKIAKTKVGIIKSQGVLSKVIPPASARSIFSLRSAGELRAVGTPSSFATPLVVVTGVRQTSVIKIVEERCREVGAKLYRLGKDFDESIIGNYKLSLLGDYQRENASLAVQTVRHLVDFGFKVSEDAIKKSLQTAFFPGRFEIINYTLNPKRYTLVLDGAHNPVKMKAFLKSLEKIFPTQKKIFILGFKFDKDISKMLKQIVKVADEIIVTQFKAKTDVAIHASADANSIKYQVLSMKYRGRVIVERDSKKALDKALAIQQSSHQTILVVTGSLYLVGEIRSHIKVLNSKLQITNKLQFSEIKI